MVKLAAINEAVSIVFCVVIGLIIGSITGRTSLSEDWPTDEMLTRGTLSNFLVGIPSKIPRRASSFVCSASFMASNLTLTPYLWFTVAFFSGLGVAVSLLDEQTNSLVGVAISASLLPPAVNCGVLWVAYAYVDDDNEASTTASNTGYTKKEFREAGLISLFLTLANIILIWISSILMFRMKEVLPIKKKIFWSDLGIARHIYRGRALMRQSPEDLHTKASGDAASPDAASGQKMSSKHRTIHSGQMPASSGIPE